MKKTKELTIHEQDYIRKNRLKISIADMSKKLGITEYRAQKFMKANGLRVDKETILKIKAAKWKGSKRKEKPWNWGIDENNKNMNTMTFLQYHLQLDGFNYYRKGERVCRFELWANRIKIEDVQAGKFGIERRERPKYRAL